jgi:hypothetical protein
VRIEARDESKNTNEKTTATAKAKTPIRKKQMQRQKP